MKQSKGTWKRKFSNAKLPKLLLLGMILGFSSLSNAQALDATLDPFEFNGEVNVRCYGQNSGRATCSVTGGTAPYTYAWTTGIPIQGGSTAVGLYAGNVSVTVTDSLGASITKTITLTQNPPLQSTVTWSPIQCYGGSSTVTVNATGGTYPYSGVISTVVPEGYYTYTVADANGCRMTQAATITQPDLLGVTATADPILCNGDATNVTVTATGGTAPFTGTGVSSKTAGVYDFLVTDANGCTETEQLAINQPALMSATISATDILCYGEMSEVTVSVVSGQEPYTGNGIYWEQAGQHTYTVTDYNLCQATISIDLAQPALFVATANVPQPTVCAGGSADVEVIGSGGSYPYMGVGTFSEMAGNHSYSISDANGCPASVSTTVAEGAPLQLAMSGCSVVYPGIGYEYGCGLIEPSVTGGDSNYDYSWSTTEITETIVVNPEITTTYALTVTDGNGCTGSANWTVNAVNAACSNAPIPLNSSSSSSEYSDPNSISAVSISSNSAGSSSSGSSSSSSEYSDPNSISLSSISSGSLGSSVSSGPSLSSGSSCSSVAYSSSSSSEFSDSQSISAPSSSSGSAGSNCNISGSSSKCSGVSSVSNYDFDHVLMNRNGEHFCVDAEDIADRLACGYNLGPTNMLQGAGCSPKSSQADSSASNCISSGPLESINIRYLGASFETADASAKHCGIPLSSYPNLTTGETFTINASDAGMAYLRNHTYIGIAGDVNGYIRIPSNGCENPIGKVYYPFEVIGWTDTTGNICGVIDNGGGGIQNSQTVIGQAGRESNMKPKATVSQYPNPAETTTTFEFTVPNTETVSLSVVGINGQLIETLVNKEVVANQSNSVTFDVSELQSGIYFVHLTSSEGVVKKKFVVLK